MLTVKKFIFNGFGVNTYVVSDATGECVIIDSASNSSREFEQLKQYIGDHALRPVMAVNTHGHIDHILGVDRVKAEYGIPFAVSRKDRFLVESAPMHAGIYGFTLDKSPLVDVDLDESGSVKFGDTELQVISTPGHTPGHVALYGKIDAVLFTGDTLFKGSIGRTDLPGGDYSWIMKSILERIVPLGDEVKVYPGHGETTSIGQEVLTNPFIVEVVQGEVNF